MDENHVKALKELARNGKLTQRELSKKIGLSLGRANFVVNSLIEKGYVKAQRFRNSHNKLAYMYVLTPAGIRKKTEAFKAFITRKTMEHEILLLEIEELRREIEAERETLSDV